jgi:hypothetical protein
LQTLPQKDQDWGAWHFYSDRFVFNSHTGEFYMLSPEGARALSMALDGAGADQISQELIETFGAEPTAALRDAEQFMARLKGLRLLEQQTTRNKERAVRNAKGG